MFAASALAGVVTVMTALGTGASAALFALSYARLIQVGVDKDPAGKAAWALRFNLGQAGLLGLGAMAGLSAVVATLVALAGAGAFTLRWYLT